MFIQQADLLRGMDRDFINEFLNIAVKETYKTGDFLFHSGENAGYFYILVKGHIRISLGHFGHVVHVVDHTGEAFGWSALVGREVYSSSAQCVVPTKVLRLENEKIQRVLEKYPATGLIFFNRLANILGARLIQSYEIMPGVTMAEDSMSFGTGQVMEVLPI